MIPKTIEDIYPLTIISPRYIDGVIIFNATSSAIFKIDDIEELEELSYLIQGSDWLEKNIIQDFGKGATIVEAFENYKNKKIKQKNNN